MVTFLNSLFWYTVQKKKSENLKDISYVANF